MGPGPAQDRAHQGIQVRSPTRRDNAVCATVMINSIEPHVWRCSLPLSPSLATTSNAYRPFPFKRVVHPRQCQT